MLARPGAIPSGAGWRFEPKLDGFRCLVCRHGRFRARSRRGWDMTKLLPQLADAIPRDVQLDGEIVAWDEEGRPDFHRLSARMLHGDSTISVSYVVFDLLALDRAAVTDQPYELQEVPARGAAARAAAGTGGAQLRGRQRPAGDRGLEGAVAKRENDQYRPG